MLELFKRMFQSKTAVSIPIALPQLEFDLSINGYHVFDFSYAQERYYNIGASRAPTPVLVYQGSTSNLEVLKGIQHKKAFMILKGELFHLEPVMKTYTETIEKQKVIDYELKAMSK